MARVVAVRASATVSQQPNVDSEHRSDFCVNLRHDHVWYGFTRDVVHQTALHQSNLNRHCSRAAQSTCGLRAVTRKEYIDWVRKEVQPIQYDKQPAFFQHSWPPDAGDGADFGDSIAPGEVVIMTQTSPDRCALRPCTVSTLLEATPVMHPALKGSHGAGALQQTFGRDGSAAAHKRRRCTAIAQQRGIPLCPT